VAVGLNDSVLVQDKRNLVSVSKYGENILQIFKHIVDWNKGNYDLTHRLLVVGPTNVDETRSAPVEWDETLYYRNAEVKRYNEQLKEICYPNNIRFLNLFDTISFDTCDGVHLNSDEHKLIFEAVVGAVNKILYKIED
jgi:lysophospholipase L1-like esterase